jgi:alpha-L-fucosidase
LLEIRKWLKLNGEAVHGTSPWEFFGQGPTEVAKGHFGEMKIKDFLIHGTGFGPTIDR